jgi:hypothetical protein
MQACFLYSLRTLAFLIVPDSHMPLYIGFIVLDLLINLALDSEGHLRIYFVEVYRFPEVRHLVHFIVHRNRILFFSNKL